MKKNVISLAVAATVASSAAIAGMHVSPDKTGQVLLFPMYNADNGNATNFHYRQYHGRGERGQGAIRRV
jgi:hypothetical protein